MITNAFYLSALCEGDTLKIVTATEGAVIYSRYALGNNYTFKRFTTVERILTEAKKLAVRTEDYAFELLAVGNVSKGVTVTFDNGVINVSGTPTDTAVSFYSLLYDDAPMPNFFVKEHYYGIIGNSAHARLHVYEGVSVSGSNVITRKIGDSLRLSIVLSNLTAGAAINESVPIHIVDLTQMFGSGNEPTTIEEFYQRIPMGVDLNAYNEGEVISMAASGIKSVGRNQ